MMETRFILKRPCRHSQGFVLLTTMILISLLSTLILSCLSSILLHNKVQTQFKIKNTDFYQLEQVAYEIMNTMQERNACLRDKVNLNEALTELNSHGCQYFYDEREYFYIISNLGDYTGLPKKAALMQYFTHHYLITVRDRTKRWVQFRTYLETNSHEPHYKIMNRRDGYG